MLMRTFFTFSRQPLRMQWSTLGGFNLGCRQGDRNPQGQKQVSRPITASRVPLGLCALRASGVINVKLWLTMWQPSLTALLRLVCWSSQIESSVLASRPNPMTKSTGPASGLCSEEERRKPALPTDLHPAASQARTLEWAAISFSSAWKEKWKGSRSVVPNS